MRTARHARKPCARGGFNHALHGMAALIVALEVGRAGASHGRDKNAKVTLVRTGKCASKTIETYLRDCRVQYQGIHVDEGPVRPKDVQGHKNIIALRDPVSRAISAFNWRHPAHGSALDHTGKDGVKFRASVVRAKAALARAGHGTALVTEAMLYACFDHANDFANALDEPTACGYVARRALASPRAAGNVGSNSKGAEITGHLPRGFAYYLADVLHLLTATGAYPRLPLPPSW